MKQLTKISAWAGLIAGIIGGISRLAVTPVIFTSRSWAGVAIILLLFAIAIKE